MTGASDASLTVHVVDDDAGVRDSLRVLLETAGLTVETHASAMAFLAAEKDAAGCVLSDVRMPGMDGLELQRRLNESGSALSVVLMTAHGAVATAVRGMKAGAVDFLEKPFGADQLLSAIGRALKGSRQRYARVLAAREACALLATLTPREREVLELLVTGLSTKAIARSLHASPRTVDVHRARVFGKLHAESLPELVRLTAAARGEDEATGG